MNTPADGSITAAETATLTKAELFERFLTTERIRRGRTTFTQETILEFCEATLEDHHSSLVDELCASDDPEEELGEMVLQLMGCAGDLKAVLADLQQFTAQHRREGGRVTTRICIPSASGSRICGSYEERDGMVDVHFNGRKKSTTVGKMYAHNLAATILREMVASAA